MSTMPFPSEDLATIVAHAQQQDEAAFTALIERFTPRMYGCAMTYLHDPDKADDAVQDAWILAWTRIGRTQPDLCISAWLYKIVKHRCLDELRHHRILRVDPIEPAMLDIRHAAWDQQPEEAALEHELATAVNRLLTTAPPDDQWAIIMHNECGMRMEDMAEAIGQSPGCIKSRRYRGFRRLRTRAVALRLEAPGRVTG